MGRAPGQVAEDPDHRSAVPPCADEREKDVFQALGPKLGPPGDDLRDRPERHHLAPLHDQEPGADLLHQVQQVRAQNDGGPARGAAHDRGFHPADADRVQAGQRLIQEQRPGLVQQPAGDGELLLHPSGQLAGQGAPLVGQVQLLQQARDPGRRRRHAVEPADEAQVLLHREVFEEVGLVGNEGEGAPWPPPDRRPDRGRRCGCVPVVG